MEQVSQAPVSDPAWKRRESILASTPGLLCHPAAIPLPSLPPSAAGAAPRDEAPGAGPPGAFAALTEVWLGLGEGHLEME